MKKQLQLRHAPQFDMYGLHDPACECGRCAVGYRPTLAQRWAARAAFERAKEREALTPEEKTEETRKAKARAAAAARAAELAAVASAYLLELAKYREAPVLTDDEINNMRRAAGLPPRRRKGTR